VKNFSFFTRNPYSIIILIIMLSLNGMIQSQTIIPGGFVSGNWDTVHSPYLVEGDLLVHPDSTLVIGEGTNILFRGQYRLEIQGQLLVLGTSGMPVIFRPDIGFEHWGGLFFNSTDTSITDSSIMVDGLISDCYQYPCLAIVNSSRLRVSDFIIQEGNCFRGGGISCSFSSPLFENLQVHDNAALDGAGISLEDSDPLLINCIITWNLADGAGGGMVIFDASAPILENCTISANQSFGSGGGIYMNGSSPVFKGCLIKGNLGASGESNLYSGGGVSVKLGCLPYFENCSFENNISLREGGAIASFSPNEMIDCLFAGNSAGTLGGGVFLSSGNLIVSNLTNCTFSDNDSPQGTAFATHNHTGVLRNCILWQSTPTNPGSLIYLDAPFSWNVMDAGYSDIQNGQAGIENSGTAQYTWGAGNIDLDPAFEPGGSELSWQSPCIEAATPDTSGLMLPETDLAGNLRFVNERVDIGAYEYQFPVLIQNSKFKIQNYIRVYPNPARDRVYVYGLALIHEAVYQLFNTKSELVLNGKIIGDQENVEINISGLPAGIYVIEIKGDDFRFTKKIIVLD
jgi:parallel beta-helix repeat protein